jgi:hypothetical protein
LNIEYARALKTARDLKISNPKKFNELIEQFKQMSSGSNGGLLFSSNYQINVRDHYYTKWKDEDFKKLVQDLCTQKSGDQK